MTADTTSLPSPVSQREVMASVDEGRSGKHLIIADIECDDAWLSVRLADAPTLDAWR